MVYMQIEEQLKDGVLRYLYSLEISLFIRDILLIWDNLNGIRDISKWIRDILKSVSYSNFGAYIMRRKILIETD